MLTTAYYFLQVMLCSGVMMGYYLLVLRNKRFHQYNRFYLLIIALLSWIVPLVKIRWSHPVGAGNPQVIQFLSVVADSNSQIDETLINNGFQWSWDATLTLIYITVAGILLVAMLRAFFRLYRLLQEHSCKNVGDVYLVLTQAKGTPFSFFRYIFWNEDIDIRSEAGKQILQHELTHVQQKHSVDKIFMQVVLIAGWFNPFFWLLKKEMNMIHEFIADKKAVNNGDTASLAQMLLTAAYPQQQFGMTHPFFFSPIKRRLQMLTNNKNPRFSYIRRLIVLPLLAIVVILFAFRSKEQRAHRILSVASVVENVVDAISSKSSSNEKPAVSVFDHALLGRPYTVVIDAGHGGADKGIMAADGTTESAIALQLARAIRDLNENENIDIILTRDADVFQNAQQKTAFANSHNPDLFISLHCNETIEVKHVGGAATEAGDGIEFFIPVKENAADYTGSRLLATHLNASMSKLNEKMLGVKSRQKGAWMLQNVKSPSVIIETGFIHKNGNVQKLKEAAYQKQMAESILQGINNYLGSPRQKMPDTAIAKIDTLVLKDGTKVAVINEGGQTTIKSTNWDFRKPGTYSDVLFILDGRKVNNDILQAIDPGIINSINVLKGETAIARYGEEGRNGVIVINTKQITRVNPDDGSVPNALPGRSPMGISGTITGGTFSGTLSGGPIVHGTIQGGTFQGNDGTTIRYPDTVKWVKGRKIDPKLSEVTVVGYGTKPVRTLVGFPIDNPGIRDFKKRNPSVKNVGWKNEGNNIMIDLKDGTEETYDLTNPGSKKRAENKYGKLPATPPAPVSQPIAEVVAPGTLSNITTRGVLTAMTVTGKVQPATRIQADNLTVTGHITPAVTREERVIPPSFPGGPVAWAKYLERNLNQDIIKKNGGPPGRYTVVISFIIDETGAVTQVTAENDPGYGAREEALRIIRKSPKWTPATSGGRAGVYRQRQSVSFFVPDPKARSKAAEADSGKQSQIFNTKLAAAKVNNSKPFFTIDGHSCITAVAGSAWTNGLTDIIIVDGKRLTPAELNRKYKRSDFVIVASSDSPETIRKFGKAALLASTRLITYKEMQQQLAINIKP